jgi:hypothetical protein
MLTCKDASHLISQGQERPLGWRERWALKFHLLMCVYCRRFDRQIGWMRQAMREMGRRAEADAEIAATGDELSPEARERMLKALAKQCNHTHPEKTE